MLSGETPPSRQDSISLEIPAEGHIGSAFWAIEVSVHIWPGELADYFEKRREEILGSSTFRGFFPDADFSQLTRRVTRINPRWLDLAAFTAENNDGSKTWQELMDAWEDQGREVTRGGLTAFIASARSAYVRVTGRKLVWKRKR